VRFRIAIVVAILAAVLLLPGLARAEDGPGTGANVAVATVTGFSDGNGVPISGSANGFADGNGAPTVGSTDGFSDGNDGAATGSATGTADGAGTATSDFGMSDGNG
jgi:hypothetical protein